MAHYKTVFDVPCGGRPAVQCELVGLAITEGRGQHYFLVIKVAAGQRFCIDVEEGLRMREVASVAQWQIERNILWPATRAAPGKNSA